MKISLGLAASAALAVVFLAGLSASADPAPRFKQNGDPCTAEEIANPPVMKVRYKGRIIKLKVDCRTEAEWKLERSTSADNERARKRQLDSRIYAPSYSSYSGEGGNVSQSQ